MKRRRHITPTQHEIKFSIKSLF